MLSINTPNLAGFTSRRNSKAKNRKELESRKVTIVLNGNWKAVNADKRVKIIAQSGQTVITGFFKHGIPIQLELMKR